MTPKILITNDDGIHAQGIKHLINSLKTKAELTVVAPAHDQSGVGLSISLRGKLKAQKMELFPEAQAFSVTGTPADCVKMGLKIMMKSPPDLILSGINCGSNHGRTILYSGTCGGVIEGIFQGIPGIAFSCYDIEEPGYHLLEPYIPQIMDYVLKNPLPSGTMLNVNFPSNEVLKGKGPQGIKLTRQGKQYWHSFPKHHSEDNYILDFELPPPQFHESEDSDVFWLDRGYITCVPVHVDELTDWRYLNARKENFEKFFT